MGLAGDTDAKTLAVVGTHVLAVRTAVYRPVAAHPLGGVAGRQSTMLALGLHIGAGTASAVVKKTGT